eukprot:CCRYP_011361-RA/>CCRYP_011361-RA protein AED:0.17 eAED:0.11 QI:0/0/0/0.8/0.25/0.2/5/0/1137
MHQAFFSPPMHTLIKAINNGHLLGVPFMKPDLICKYLTPSPATSKGRMKHPCTGIRSTRINPIPPDSTRPLSPTIPTQGTNTSHIIRIKPIGDSSCNVFCYAALADKHTGTLYTDATGALLAVSLDGNQYYVIAYAYDPNYVFAKPIPNLRDETLLQTFDEVFQELKTKGLTPTFNVTDNQAAQSIKAYLAKEKTKWQFVEPNNHRVNAAERAIQTYKNHFISGLCTTDKDWALQLWDTLTQQALITLNLLQTSRIDPTKSAYHQLHGHRYDWNAHPLAPPGTKAIIYEAPNTRTSWGPRGLDAWYCEPSLDHYRNAKFYVPTTKLPHFCTASYPLSHQNNMYKKYILNFLKQSNNSKKPTQRKFLHKVAKALEKLTTNQQSATTTDNTSEEADVIFQRVSNTPEVTTTSTPTDPTTVKQTPRIHQRVTRGNTPRQLPAIVNPDHPTQPNRRSPHLHNLDDEPIHTIREPSSSRSPLHSPHLIAFQAVNLLTHKVYADPKHTWVPDSFISSSPMDQANPCDVDIEHFCAGVQHPVTGETITKYKILIKMPEMNEIWTTAFGKEFGNLAQGDLKTGEKGTNTLFVMSHDEIANIPNGRTKADPNRVRITAGGNLIKDYPGELTTRTADLTTSQIMWNSVLSTARAKFMGVDIKSFFLTAPLDRYEYMKMPLDLFPEHTIQQYDLRNKAKNGFVYLEICRCMYGLPMARALANKLLRERLAPHGYYEVAHTPGLWHHVWRPLSFTLVVDDFGVKYVGKQHAQHLIDTLKQHYMLAEDWAGDLYCGIKLDWDYDKRTLIISLPGYIQKVLQRFQHDTPSTPQHCPFQPNPRKFGTDSQDTLPPDESNPLEPGGITRVQQVVGALLFYARAVDNTILPALSTIASSQAAATEQTLARCTQLLDYCASNPDAKVQYRAPDMILNIHSDASYLSAPRARSQVAGYYFLGSVPTDDAPINLNGAILVFCGILKFVVASAAEAELGGLFLNCKEGKIQRLILEELGHKQPSTLIHCDNATATGIANDAVKKTTIATTEILDVRWQQGQENLADYFTKHFEPRHHINVRPWYLHTSTPPTLLPRANAPSSLRGCVGTLPNGYTRTSPLPQIPSSKNRVPHGRQLSGLQISHPYPANRSCIRTAPMA